MRLRILFTAGPMYGHVNTLLPLALAARRAGHSVAFATGPDLAVHVRRHGLEVWPVGPTHAESGGRAGLSIDYFVAAAAKRAVELVPRAVSWRPDLVIHEETELAGAVVASATGARQVVHGLGLPLQASMWDALAPGLDALHREWSVGSTAAAVLSATRLDVCPPSLRPPGELLWPDPQLVRPVAGTALASERLPDALAGLPRARTVHLTLGTVFHEEGALAAALAGLRDLDMNVVVTVGPDVDPSALGRQPDHVHVAGYVPHSLLLPMCSLVVSQGGAGVMLGAIALGLPQLILPQGADQFRNAEAAARAGVALALAPADVTPSRVGSAARTLLDEPAFRTATNQLEKEVAAMPHPDQVLTTLTEGPR